MEPPAEPASGMDSDVQADDTHTQSEEKQAIARTIIPFEARDDAPESPTV